MWEQLVEDAPRFFSSWNLLFLGEALLNTLLLSYVGAALGFAIGFGLAIGRHPRLYGFGPVRVAATGYVETFRRIPFLVKLMCVFFAFQLSGAQASLFTIALVTVVLSAAAFAAEIARAGIESVPAPQWDAAEAMNFSRWRVLTRIVAPQSWRVVLPPLFGYAVGFIKSTSIASQIGVMEMTYAAKILNTRGFSALLCFGTILIVYFLICWPTKRFGERLEARLGRRAKA
ncbi:amino acid ABC transporter permease [Neoroseomonas rubea]|uniref:amino acid ABC transporter permease n=1 Tax=Neoroseomonas rubea TaxID=2748666 RepID=UPI0018DFAAA4|nr:amino acid ABC transporter permease [Roseomonas rubea]